MTRPCRSTCAPSRLMRAPRRSSLRLLWLLLLFLMVSSGAVDAALSAAAVVPASTVAGASGAATVSFTSDVDIDVGSRVAVAFPSGFALDAGANTVTVDGVRFTTTLAVKSITTTTIECEVGTAAILANTQFQFQVSAVTNPGTGTTDSFTITIKHSNAALPDENQTVAPIQLQSGLLAYAHVVPDSKVAGAVGTASVSFTSAVGLPVGSVIEVSFPAEFSIAATTVLTVGANLDAGSVASTYPGTRKICVVVAGSAVAAGSAVSFKVSDVTNAGATTTGVFGLVTMDSSFREYESDAAISAVDIASGALATAHVGPDSKVAGAVGTASVSFTSAVGLPVGSVIEVSFPAEFSIAATTVLTVGANLDAGSVASTYPGTRKICVVVAGSAVAAGSAVSFKVSDVTNAGATTTGVFGLVTMDSSFREFESDAAISTVDIVSTSLVSANLEMSTVEAGVSSVVGVNFNCAQAVPLLGRIVLFFPADMQISSTIQLSEDAGSFSAAGSLVLRNGQKVGFVLSTGLAAGEYTARVSGLWNPGVSTTGRFVFYTTDNVGRIIETASLPGITTTAGGVMTARFSALNPHPGIASNVQLSFVTPAALLEDTLVYVSLANGDYSFAVSNPSVVIHNPLATTASISWDTPNTAFAVTISSAGNIPEGSLIDMTIIAFNMPPSVRSEMVASIQTWNALGLRLDGPSVLTLDAITAVTALPVSWKTTYPYPGITSPVVLTFDTNGALPTGGKIKIEFPATEFSATTFTAPTVTFQNPSTSEASVAWDATAKTLLLTIGTAPLAALQAYSTGVQLTIRSLDTPVAARGAAPTAWMSTLDPSGVLIDGPSSITLDSIVPGPISGSRLWVPTRANPGITTDQTISFYSNGRVGVGGTYEFTLPDTKWSTGSGSVKASFIQPSLGDVGDVTWDNLARLLTVKLQGSTVVPAYSLTTIVISGMQTPPKETAITTAYLTTRASDGGVIDGPGILSIEALSRGTFSGMMKLESTTTTSASMISNQKLSFTLSGALPSGSTFTIAFPSGGWRPAASSVSASFLSPASGVSVASSAWDAQTRQIVLTTAGDLVEASDIILSIDGLVNPYDVESSLAAPSLWIKSALADAGVVDESFNIQINSIAASDLGSSSTLVSAVATPGVAASHQVRITTGGQLEPKSSICMTFPAADAWDVLSSATATFTSSTAVDSAMEVKWSPASGVLCLVFNVAVPQSTALTVTITNVRTPPSERGAAPAAYAIYSHLGGLVNIGQLQLNAIVRGALSGERKWQSALFSPGPVASLTTTATLTFTTTGRITPTGIIMVTLPIEWEIAARCSASFLKPTVFGTATCLQNTVSVSLRDTINEYTEVEILVGNVMNPPTVLPSGTAFIQTKAADGGMIDESSTVTTGAIESALLDVVSVDGGDVRVAVVGADKKFRFQGFSVNGGDIIKFVDASTTSGMNCGTATTGVSDVGGIEIATLSDNHEVALRFMQSSVENEPFMLCYKFGSNPFKLYRGFAFTVKEVSSVTVTEGKVGVAVADYPKTWIFHGRGLAVGDLVRWIDAASVQDAVARGTSPDCLDSSFLARLVTPTGMTLAADEDEYTRRIGAFNDAVVVFSAPEDSGKTFFLCYRFGNEPYKIYQSMSVEVKHVKRIEAAVWGADTVAVVDYPKTFSFVGDGLATNDRLYFVQEGIETSCASSTADPSLRLSHTLGTLVQSVLFITSSSDTVINFVQAEAGKRALLCYQFGSEPYQLYPSIRLDIKMVTAFVGNRGSPELAVAEVPEPLTFQGFGLSAGDEVRWIHSAEEDCDAHTAMLTEAVTFAPIDTLTIDADHSSFFNFTAKQDDYQPVLCYKFGIEKYKLYANLDIKIATLTAKTTTDGSREVAVVGSRKAFTLYGTHLAEGDRVSWTQYPLDIGCVNTSLLVRNTATKDDDYVSFMNDRSQFAVAFAAFSSGERVYLCYGFGSEPYKVYHNLYLDVKSVTNMRTLRGANGVAVSGVTKTFLFEGDGVATGDYAKFVPTSSGDCSAPGISLTNIQKEFDDTLEVAIYLYENIAGITVGSFQFGADRASAGLSRVLCYRFGNEKFFFYQNLQLDVKTIWSLSQVDELFGGQPSVAVVDELKMIAIDGAGVSQRDKVKWIDGAMAQNDQACDDLPAQGLFARTISVFSNRTMWFPFEYGSEGKTWRLCYKFEEEPYRLFTGITVTVKAVTGLLDSTYPNLTTQGTVAVIGQPKMWRPLGSGVQEGDTVKFVPSSVTASADCGVGSANTAGDASLMKLTGALPTFTGLFNSFPVSLTDVYHVCYKFQDEPFTYVKDLEIATYGVVSIDRKTFLAGASTPLQVTGFRLSNTDRLGWTSDNSATGCSMVFNIVSVTDARASVVFDKAYDILVLCYSFDRQPFVLFRSITVSVVVADVWVPSTVAVVAGLPVEIQLAGTFGLTVSSDQVAWVPSDALSCSPAVMALYASTMSSSVVTTSASTTALARAGSSVVSVTFVSPPSTTATEALSTWKLCYKFGNVAEFIMFGDVLCDVLSIQRIDLTESRPTTTGLTMTFAFIGIGQQDFDIAKWIDASSSTSLSDDDCELQPAVGGSIAASVLSGSATYDFLQAISAMALCYKFNGQPSYKSFSNLPVKDLTKRSSSSGSTPGANALTEASDVLAPQFVPNRDVATVSLKLNKNINDYPPGTPAEATFKADFAIALSLALGIDSSRIEILELLAGSVIVKFKLLPSDNVADPLVHEIMQDLQTQLLDPASALLTQSGTIIAITDPSGAISSEIVPTADVTSTTVPPTAFSVRGYQRGGLFSFAADSYSITEKTSRLFLRILRQQGASVIVTLPFRLESKTRTARYGEDYRITSPSSIDLDAMFLRFEIGEVAQTIEIEVFDDNVKEAHFESFKLILGDPGAPDTALGAISETTVRIYDYDDGTILQRASFPAPTDRRVNLLGWSVVENGDSAVNSNAKLRVDSNGLFAIDQVVGDVEYNQKCDLASPTGACGFACEVGASLGSTATVESSYRVLNLAPGDATSYVATVNPVISFPTSAFTISFWIRTTHKSRSACILSYALTSGSDFSSKGLGGEDGGGSFDAPVALAMCDPTNLHVAIDALDVGSDNHGRRGGLATFVDVTDGAWHFIAVNWQSGDGRIKVYDNGMLAFDGGPYRIGYSLPPRGFLVLGQLASTCSSAALGLPPVECVIAPGRGLVAELQHLSVWSRLLSRSELLRQLQWPIKIVTNGLVLAWNFDSHELRGSGPVSDLSTRGVAQKNDGFVCCGSESSPCATPGVVPSVAPNFPCGPVYRNVWHFAAPANFVEKLASSYGGRLQFRMLAPSQNGAARPRRGQISIFDAAGNHVSLALRGFPLPSGSAWTYYSAVLREDFGWLDEPAGEPLATAQFQIVLRGATALWIRGDLWGPSGDAGNGQEVVYLNDITLFGR